MIRLHHRRAKLAGAALRALTEGISEDPPTYISHFSKVRMVAALLGDRITGSQIGVGMQQRLYVGQADPRGIAIGAGAFDDQFFAHHEQVGEVRIP